MSRSPRLALVLAAAFADVVPAQETTLPEPPPTESAPPALRLAATIALPDVAGRIDHLAVDLARGRAYLAALGNGSVEVVDLKAKGHVQSLRGLHEPQGIAYLADRDRIVVACGGSGTCEVLDGETGKSRASVAVGDDADNVRYDAASGRLFVGCDGALVTFDVDTWQLVGRVPLDGHPESFQLDRAGRRAYVNVPSAQQVAVVDVRRLQARKPWRIDEAGGNFPMALAIDDEQQTRWILLGCRNPARLVTRTADGKAVQTLDLAGDVDDLFVDASHHLVYAVCGAGFVEVFEDRDGALRPRERIATRRGARTGLLVPERDELLVAVPRQGDAAAELRVFTLRR